jgi:hypothetical protein
MQSCINPLLLPPRFILDAMFIRAVCLLSLPLKVRARRKESHALVHDRLADPEVVVDPFLHTGCLGEGFGFYTGTVSTRVSLIL